MSFNVKLKNATSHKQEWKVGPDGFSKDFSLEAGAETKTMSLNLDEKIQMVVSQGGNTTVGWMVKNGSELNIQTSDPANWDLDYAGGVYTVKCKV